MDEKDSSSFTIKRTKLALVMKWREFSNISASIALCPNLMNIIARVRRDDILALSGEKGNSTYHFRVHLTPPNCSPAT